eukprot:2294947-Pleurochrysis_carterae.AAC.3
MPPPYVLQGRYARSMHALSHQPRCLLTALSASRLLSPVPHLPRLRARPPMAITCCGARALPRPTTGALPRARTPTASRACAHHTRRV